LCIYTLDHDIIGLTETWLTDAILDNEILPINYSIYRADRDTRGGGVFLAVKDTIPSQCIESPKDLEVVTVLIGSNNPVKIVWSTIHQILVLSTNMRSLINYLQSFTANSSELIIMEDFNVSDINWANWSSSSPFSDELCDTFSQYNNLSNPHLWQYT